MRFMHPIWLCRQGCRLALRLGPYGQPKYLKQIGQLIEAGPGGEDRLNLNIIRSYKKNIIRSYKKTECFPGIFANCWEPRRALTDRRLARFMHERFSSGPECAEIMLRAVDFQ